MLQIVRLKVQEEFEVNRNFLLSNKKVLRTRLVTEAGRISQNMSMARVALARRRQEENIIRERNEYINENFKAERVSEWEQKISHRIQKQNIIHQVNQLKQRDEINLLQRRQKMEDLYSQETEQWKQKLEEMDKKSTSEKMTELRQKAYNLKESREKKRQQFVEECYDRQRREACDDTRILRSRAITDKCMNDRKYLVEHKIMKENITNNTPVPDEQEEIRKKMNVLENKELTEKEAQKNKQLQLKLALDEQVKSIRLKTKSSTLLL